MSDILSRDANHAPRIALIGCGNFARQQHLPNLAQLAAEGSCRLHTLCDRDADLLTNLREQYRPQQIHTEATAVLADPDIDGVIIAVRDDLQADLAIHALQAGKAVYVEKPLAPTPLGCLAVADAHAAMGSDAPPLAVGFQKRFAPIYQRARTLLATDGGCRLINVRMADDAWRWAHGYEPGYLITHDLCHLFDLLPWLTGSPICEIHAMCARLDEDAMVLRCANGAVATLIHSGHATMDLPKERLEAYATRGSIQAEDYVELRTFGFPDAEPAEYFAGSIHPERDALTADLLGAGGLNSMHQVRRAAWLARAEFQLDGENPASAEGMAPQTAARLQFAKQTIPNFLRDQGWLASLRAFMHGLRDGTPLPHATATDAAVAARVAAAAVASRDQGHPITLTDIE